MKITKRRLRALDLYSGVGGWGLGLKLAGIDVVASFEYWGPANETNFKNNRHQTHTVDIRRLSLDELPKNIDVVVGSPPCTQFSFSNRGGNGDIADGLRDVIKFLTIVDHLRPRAWAMENVPRVAGIIEQELLLGGRLRRFKHLNIQTYIVDMDRFGVPQRRQRCIAGNFDYDLFASYAEKTVPSKLGEVISSLARMSVTDPIYGIKLFATKITDHVAEDFLNTEEIRINRSNKTIHPVYNAMPFPDRLDRTVRTITATCTRVSRESVIVRDSTSRKEFRRLTIRERASLQGFPITFQFYGSSYTQKLKMVGNAIPPNFTYLVAHAMKGTVSTKVPCLATRATKLRLPTEVARDAKPHRAGAQFPTDRRFRFSIPSLRLKSGVRFELANRFDRHIVAWEVRFYFGTSKTINSLTLDSQLQKRLMQQMPDLPKKKVLPYLQDIAEYIRASDLKRMQQIWSHRGPALTTPFMLLDKLDECGESLKIILAKHEFVTEELVLKAVGAEYEDIDQTLGVAKLVRNAPLILAGLLVGSVANFEIAREMGSGLTVRASTLPQSAVTGLPKKR